MAIPVATTTISVLRVPAQTDAWPDSEPTYATIASGIRANLSKPMGQEGGEAGSRGLVTARLTCDPTDLVHGDVVLDALTGRQWHVNWAEHRMTLLPHVVAGVHDVASELEAAEVTH